MSSNLDSDHIEPSSPVLPAVFVLPAVLATLWRRQVLMVAIVATAFALGIIANPLMPDSDTAQAYVSGEFFAAPDTVAKDDESITAGSMHLDLERVIETETRLLLSHQLARRVVRQLGLERLRPLVSKCRLLPAAFFGSAAKTLRYEVGIAAARLLDGLSVENYPGTCLITVPFSTGEQRYLAQATLSIRLAKLGDKHSSVPQERLIIPVRYSSPVGTGLDANGWTMFTPARNTRVIYVSTSGSDSKDGLSPNTAVASIAKGISLLRNGSADQILLKKGDIWHESIGWPMNVDLSGRSALQPILISSYGTGARPVIASGFEGGFDAIGNGTISNVAIVGLDFYADARDPNSPTFSTAGANANPAGIRILTNADNILIEDTVVRFYKDNVVLQNNNTQLNNITLHRNIITDSYATSAHSQGLYADMGTGLVLDGNLFDHNGRNPSVPDAGPTMFNHNIYIQTTNGPATLNNNISANASSHGAQVRSGGTITDNLFVRNPIELLYGGKEGVSGIFGVSAGTVSGNVFTEANDIDANNLRGWGLDVNPTAGPVQIINNIFTHATSGVGFGVNLEASVSDDEVTNNIFYRWNNPINNVDSSSNVFSNNQIDQAGYLDPSRTVATYSASLGYAADLNAFLAEARLQRKDNWNPQLTANAVNQYIREGFNVGTSSAPPQR